jgi:hypothetical protein
MLWRPSGGIAATPTVGEADEVFRPVGAAVAFDLRGVFEPDSHGFCLHQGCLPVVAQFHVGHIIRDTAGRKGIRGHRVGRRADVGFTKRPPRRIAFCHYLKIRDNSLDSALGKWLRGWDLNPGPSGYEWT